MKWVCRALIVITIFTSISIPGYMWYRRHPDGDCRARSYIYLLDRYVMQKKYLIAESIYGTKFKFNIRDAVGRSIYKGKDYESDLTKFVLKTISYEPSDVILDVGANLGWYSINISKLYPDNSIQIFAFEPDDVNFALLKENIKLNNTTNIMAINKAIAEKYDQKVLYKYPDKNLGRHSLFRDHKLDQQQMLVETISLDEFITTQHLNTDKIKLLKIDVEGYEYQVLLGCIKTLPNILYILHEFSPLVMRQNNINPKELLNLLLNNNFEAFMITERGTNIKPINLIDMVNLSEVTNLLWINNKIKSFKHN